MVPGEKRSPLAVIIENNREVSRNLVFASLKSNSINHPIVARRNLDALADILTDANGDVIGPKLADDS